MRVIITDFLNGMLGLPMLSNSGAIHDNEEGWPHLPGLKARFPAKGERERKLLSRTLPSHLMRTTPVFTSVLCCTTRLV